MQGLSAPRRSAPAIDVPTLRETPAELREETVELELVVAQGPDEGTRYALSASHPSPCLVGQSPTCDLRLTDRSVSRRHAAIDATGWPVRVRDLGSTNGTFVNGVAVVEAYLTGGETLRMGVTTLRTERRPAAPRPALDDRGRFGRTLGESAAMRRLYPLFDVLAARSDALLIEGEPGTGKELLAECLHECGPRAPAAFVVVDCVVGAKELARSHRERGGAFEALLAQASGGTIVFDEIAELDPPLQRALARALAAPLEARVIAATKTDLDGLVQRGRFREDLYARLSSTRVELPPLRARAGDVRLLARHFWTLAGGGDASFPSDAVARAEAGAWPGNVRELRDLMGKLVHQDADSLPPPPGAPLSDTAKLTAVFEELLAADVSYTEARRRLLVHFENRYVERMLAAHNGNVTRAAAASGLARRNFQLIRARRRDDGG
jgi:DNA-binding NtrC family response regulator